MGNLTWAEYLGLARFRERQLGESATTLNTGWEDVLVPQGMALCAQAWHDTDLLNWARTWAEHHLGGQIIADPSRVVQSREMMRGQCLADYCGNWGMPHVLVPLFRATNDPALKAAAVHVCETLIAKAFYVGDRIMAHSALPGVHRHLWVDTLYYSSSVLAQTYSITGNLDYAKEALRQGLAHAQYLQDPATGCYFHDANVATGERTHCFWARGNGWVILTLADLLRHCPRDAHGYSATLQQFRTLVTGLLRYRHPCGLWRIVPEDERSHLETSGSIMITTAILMGINDGHLPKDLLAGVRESVREIVTWVRGDGALMGAQRPAGLGGWERHKHSELGECTYANGLLLRLVAEIGRDKAQFDPILSLLNKA